MSVRVPVEWRAVVHETLERRFLAGFASGDGCWLWSGRPGNNGYGRVRCDNGGEQFEVSAHRFSYEYFVGPIPEGLTIDHLCRVRLCVNPAHLEVVTIGENTRRMWAAVGPQLVESRHKTHCKSGHELNSENSYKDGPRVMCRLCRLARVRAWRAKRAAS